MRTGAVRQSWVYNAPPTISRFLQSDAFGRLIWGPVGSGKTTLCVVEAARRMAEQQPGADGRRYSRIAIIRQSLKDAKATVLKDIRGWFGSLADWKVSESTLYIEYGDVVSEWPFIPLDEPDDVKRLLSLQLTGAYVNECIETDIDLLSDIAGRVGRYPNNEYGACTWSGIWMDTNAPIIHTPWANFIDTPPPQWQVFHQPGGHEFPKLDPVTGVYTGGAENLAHLNQTAETMLLPEDDPRRSSKGGDTTIGFSRLGTPDYIRRYVWSHSVVIRPVRLCSRRVSNMTSMLPIVWTLCIAGCLWLGRISGALRGRSSANLTILDAYGAGGSPWTRSDRRQYWTRAACKQNLIPVLASERYAGRPVAVVGDPSGAARDSLFELNLSTCSKVWA